MTRNLGYRLILLAALTGLAGCSSVSQRAAERRPFFQPEYDLGSHGRKTLFDRIVELDPGGLHVTVAPDYQRNAPLKIAVLPFTDHGSANFVVDKIPLTFRDRQQRAIWAWTDAQRLRRSMVGYLSGREFYVLNPIGIDAVLHSHGITDEAELKKIPPQKLGSWLGADAVVYGEVVHYEAYYLALISAWQVGIKGKVVSTHDGEQLIHFDGSRYSVNVLPALTVQDIVINSLESLLQLRDVVLARSEEEVCRELVLRIPVSQNLRLQIARQALETDAWDENSMIPVSMTIAHREVNWASQPAHIETPADESARVNSVPNQPVTSVDIGEPAP
ncbi:MAG: GNA1162 family protein [Candidatus Binataceae bacterium]